MPQFSMILCHVEADKPSFVMPRESAQLSSAASISWRHKVAVVTQDFMTQCQPACSSAMHRAGVSDRIASLLQLWRTRWRERQALTLLGHRELREIGLSQWEVERETAKPFWRG